MVGQKSYHPEKHLIAGIHVSQGDNILQNLTYSYDGFSNLEARIDNKRNLEETFSYDHLNRLTGIWLGNTETGRMNYDAYGRMEHKMVDGQLVFTNAVYNETTKPHAIDHADTYNDVFSEQNVTYTCFDKVKTVTQGNNTLEYAYGYDRQRISMEEHTDHGNRTKRYVGNCELLTETTLDGTVVRWLTCAVGPTGAFAMVETDEKGNNTLHYILKDNLGSWSVITDKHGNIEQELSFDAWGNLRNPETWRAWSDVPEPMFDRGFTGHEHLYAFGLINMNGRMYDPQMSSFLSVDAYVQSPENAQCFNRYAYCLNNPLRYTDPSGWLPLGPMPGNPRHDDWGQSHVEPVYEPRVLGIEQLTDFEAIWMRGDELHGGGGDGGGGCSNSGDCGGNENSTPDDPPGSKKSNVQQLKERAGNAPAVISTEATMAEKAANLTEWMLGESAGLETILEYTSKIGKWCLGINIFINYARVYNKEISWQSATMRSIVSIGEYGSFSIPLIGPLVGGGLLYCDFTGRFENNLYNDAWLKQKYQYIRYDYMPTYYQNMPSYFRYY